MNKSIPLPPPLRLDSNAHRTVGELDAPIRSKELFHDRPCVYIEHEGMIYALRATRAGKLILTK